MSFEVISRVSSKGRAVHTRMQTATAPHWDHLSTTVEGRHPDGVDAMIADVARANGYTVVPHSAPRHLTLVPSSDDKSVLSAGPDLLDRISRILWTHGDFRRRGFGLSSVELCNPQPDSDLQNHYKSALHRSPLQELKVGGFSASRQIRQIHTILVDPTDMDPTAGVAATIDHITDLARLGFVSSAHIVMSTSEPFANATAVDSTFQESFLQAFAAHPRLQRRVDARGAKTAGGMVGLIGGVGAFGIGIVVGDNILAGAGFAGMFSGGGVLIHAQGQDDRGAYDPLVSRIVLQNGPDPTELSRVEYEVKSYLLGAVAVHTPKWFRPSFLRG